MCACSIKARSERHDSRMASYQSLCINHKSQLLCDAVSGSTSKYFGHGWRWQSMVWWVPASCDVIVCILSWSSILQWLVLTLSFSISYFTPATQLSISVLVLIELFLLHLLLLGQRCKCCNVNSGRGGCNQLRCRNQQRWLQRFQNQTQQRWICSHRWLTQWSPPLSHFHQKIIHTTFTSGDVIR